MFSSIGVRSCFQTKLCRIFGCLKLFNIMLWFRFEFSFFKQALISRCFTSSWLVFRKIGTHSKMHGGCHVLTFESGYHINNIIKLLKVTFFNLQWPKSASSFLLMNFSKDFSCSIFSLKGTSSQPSSFIEQGKQINLCCSSTIIHLSSQIRFLLSTSYPSSNLGIGSSINVSSSSIKLE